MPVQPDYNLLAECYRSDLARLDAIAETAWYIGQLTDVSGKDDCDYTALVESCRKEQASIRSKLQDLENFTAEEKQ